jgi:hypothetical protein
MTSQLSIMEKMGTLPDEMIHITPKCIMHLHGHQNKVVPLMKSFIFADLNNGVKFYSYTISWLMTFETTISHIELITTTSAMKT